MTAHDLVAHFPSDISHPVAIAANTDMRRFDA
jgi:hypothetical protein